MDISVSGLVKQFEVGNKILDGLSFQVNSGERVGILGKNGAGKTTLFRVLTGALEPDGGEVVLAPGKRLGLMSQIPVYPASYTVEDVLHAAFGRLQAMEREMADLTGQMARGETDPALLRRYDGLLAAFEAGGGYDTETALAKVCNGLALPAPMRAQRFSALSGGEKTRVNLARLILEDTDILLLDEPTNHLDLRATEWLEEHLEQFKGTVLVISHDRYFLDRLISRVIEIVDGQAEFYQGSYSFYAAEKEARHQQRQRQYEKEQAKIAQLQAAADKLHLWAFMGNDKLHKRAFSMEKRIERLRVTDRPVKERKLDLRFGEWEFRGDEVLTVKGLAKGFGDRVLFRDVNLEVTGPERIALLGDNGTGKSTFLKILTGEETPDSGRLRMGPTVKLGCLPQVIKFSHPERSLVDTLLYDQGCTPQAARDRLAAFKFRGDDVFKPVSALSGGEQSRLRLCMLMDAKLNLLLLDEPTNHLDLISREWIEEAVEAYEGTLLFVSHDRYFIDRFATRVWVLEDGTITDVKGTYAAYRAMRAGQATVPAPRARGVPAPKKEPAKRPGGTKELEKQVNAAERAVARAEEQMSELSLEVEAASTDYLRLQELYERREALDQEIHSLYTRWEALAQALEEARA
ncbi:MAG: ABC-F family ATP-binding cassette domain-containing protein [Clostridiales bacterium]|nr:ABC-F family ATP-binding cassette domain-containing protein [Clostridiales bacterium]